MLTVCGQPCGHFDEAAVFFSFEAVDLVSDQLLALLGKEADESADDVEADGKVCMWMSLNDGEEALGFFGSEAWVFQNGEGRSDTDGSWQRSQSSFHACWRSSGKALRLFSTASWRRASGASLSSRRD